MSGTVPPDTIQLMGIIDARHCNSKISPAIKTASLKETFFPGCDQEFPGLNLNRGIDITVWGKGFLIHQ